MDKRKNDMGSILKGTWFVSLCHLFSLLDAIGDLTEDTTKTKRKTKTSNKIPKPKPKPRTNPSLTFDPLKSPPGTSNPTSTSTDPLRRFPAADSTNKTDELIKNITELFEEFGNESEGLGIKGQNEGDDSTESILKLMNGDSNTQSNEFSPFGLDGELSENDLSHVFIQSIMKKILAKETLYEPMKDLCEKYESWLQSDEVRSLCEEEINRNKKLYSNMKELIHVYETDPENTEKLTQLFENSKQYGSPPDAIYESLTKDIAQDLDDESGLSSCFQQ
eukprot:g2098.t1